MPNVMATQQNRDGALCKSTVIPFIVAPCNFWQTPAARVPCSNAVNTGDHKLKHEICDSIVTKTYRDSQSASQRSH